MQFTTRAGLRKPEDPESADIADLNFNSDQLSDYAVGDFICTSVTRPGAPWVGMRIYETDTGASLVYVGGANPWKPLGIILCTRATRPANAVLGQEIWETNTRRHFIQQAGSWIPLIQEPATAARGAGTTFGTDAWNVAVSIANYPVYTDCWYEVNASCHILIIGGAAQTLMRISFGASVSPSYEEDMPINLKKRASMHHLFKAAATGTITVSHDVRANAPATGIIVYGGHAVSITPIG